MTRLRTRNQKIKINEIDSPDKSGETYTLVRIKKIASGAEININNFSVLMHAAINYASFIVHREQKHGDSS